MKRNNIKLILLLTVLVGILSIVPNAVSAQETLDTRIGKLEFTHDFTNGYPTNETIDKLFDEMDFQRAVQAYIWSVPLMSFEYWQDKQNKEMNLANGQMAYMVTYEEKVCCLTLNVTTPYVQGFMDLRTDGPMVIEIPKGGQVRGATHSMWQVQMSQMTQGGKYLFVGPYDEVPPEAESEGFVINHSPMNDMFFGIRLMPEDEAAREALLKQIKVYPFKDRKSPKVLPAIRPDHRWWAHAPRDMSYWETLHKSLNTQPVREVDRYMWAMLQKLGIEKGRPFKPDERQTKILKEALVVGEAMVKANDFDKRVKSANYLDGSHWEYATTASPDSRSEFLQELDEAAAWFYEAVTNDEAMHGQNTGWGQVYMATYKDSDGDWLDGGTDYVFNVPANPPAEAFWAMTLYDVSTRAIIINDIKKAGVNSRLKLANNKDGSIDLYFGPKAPKGKESNWIQTTPGKAWFPYFRLYSPTKPFLDQSWVLPDIEKR